MLEATVTTPDLAFRVMTFGELSAAAEREEYERRRPRCCRCGERVGPDGWLTFATAPDKPGRGLQYPKVGLTAAFFQCRCCALAHDDRDMGYDLELSRIRAWSGPPGGDSLVGWLTHLRGKRWWAARLYEALETAHVTARGGALP